MSDFLIGVLIILGVFYVPGLIMYIVNKQQTKKYQNSHCYSGQAKIDKNIFRFMNIATIIFIVILAIIFIL